MNVRRLDDDLCLVGEFVDLDTEDPEDGSDCSRARRGMNGGRHGWGRFESCWDPNLGRSDMRTARRNPHGLASRADEGTVDFDDESIGRKRLVVAYAGLEKDWE